MEEKNKIENPGFDFMNDSFIESYCKRAQEVLNELGKCPSVEAVNEEQVFNVQEQTKNELKIARRKRAFKIGRHILYYGLSCIVLSNPDVINEISKVANPAAIQTALFILCFCTLMGNRKRDEKRIHDNAIESFDRIIELLNSTAKVDNNGNNMIKG